MATNFSRGSEWRKWDLHIHTPNSICQEYGNTQEGWDKFINALENLSIEVKVIGITDYYFIDGYKKVMDYKLKHNKLKNIDKIFPILEFRIDTFGSGSENNLQKINLHVLFDINENDIATEIRQVEEEFIKQIPITKLERHKTKCLSIENLTQEGNNNLQNGFSSLVPPTDRVFELLNSPRWKDKCFLFLGYKEWSNLEKNQQLKPLKDDLYSKVGAFLGNNFTTNKNNQEWLNSFGNKKLLHSLDIHNFTDLDSYEFDENGNRKPIERYHCNTWIKADPTFEGLKQILYEPEERVRIQENNPAFDFEKSPFTEIQISERVDVFENEQDNVTFEKCVLPLNSNLVSIIGGRGTGKSILIDYISTGLGQSNRSISYTKSDRITIKRQPSLNDEPIPFVISNKPNIPFMYISQSEIKGIVEKPQEFTENIRKTIGVIDNYIVSTEYKAKANRYTNEYSEITKILDTNSQQKKDEIDKEIKKYNDFITNITSKENKLKLKNYQKHLNDLSERKIFYEKLQNQKRSIREFEKEVNSNIEQLNKALLEVDSNISIPCVNNSTTINYITQTALPKIKELIDNAEKEIQKTKDAFKGYTGDLTTLLSDVALYQNKVTESQKQKTLLEENEKKFETIKQNYFKELGTEIESGIKAYKQEIEDKWNNFKNGSGGYSEEQKRLLSDILGEDNLNVSVEISFNAEKMYQLLLEKLDRRSWSKEKLENTLNVSNLDKYIDFIKQASDPNAFSDAVIPIRDCVLDAFFTKYIEFITHNIVVTSQNKNITKLSRGQQGTIYLRLKLAANLFSKTIIYDQPEDDLDNEFIMSDLVSIFRKIKKYRQVIIVSHNANLVVNADSEQIIIARNEEGILKYTSGSLEDPEINEQICKILEGGKTAFLKREKKYGFK
ncbi:MAG: AAA family ATPase [Campylobacteraceae bacterium]|jgi:ABC-type cobalamin/Fe3+-siderophores transport system ATPase subunit|nr:AAA family ATPase [Campylobacteraceae bacterium]